MKFSKNQSGYIVRLEKGERFISTLTQFFLEQNLNSGTLQAIGAVESAELGFYHLDRKEYAWKKFDSLMEIVSLTGNIALVENKPFLHVHCVLSNENFETIGGHLKEAVIGATCEIFVTQNEIEIKRLYDDETGLKLLDLG